MRVAICTITYKRPESLARMLRDLSGLSFPDVPPDLAVVVVDNDPEQSARDVCARLAGEMPWPIQYETEPRRGIPFARNKAVASVVDGFDFLAFIDDDGLPSPNWLAELLSVQQAYNADVVTGPVTPEYPSDIPQWIVRGGLFDVRRRPTGQVVDDAYTGNVLVRMNVFRAMDPIFDESMALTGGTDSYFFRRAHRAGYRMVWADDAVVGDWVHRSRACASWIVQRSYRVGNRMAAIHIGMVPTCWTRCVLIAKAGVWTGLGLLSLLPGLVTGRAGLTKAVRAGAYGVGLLLGVAGTKYEEYRTTHGR